MPARAHRLDLGAVLSGGQAGVGVPGRAGRWIGYYMEMAPGGGWLAVALARAGVVAGVCGRRTRAARRAAAAGAATIGRLSRRAPSSLRRDRCGADRNRPAVAAFGNREAPLRNGRFPLEQPTTLGKCHSLVVWPVGEPSTFTHLAHLLAGDLDLEHVAVRVAHRQRVGGVVVLSRDDFAALLGDLAIEVVEGRSRVDPETS